MEAKGREKMVMGGVDTKGEEGSVEEEGFSDKDSDKDSEEDISMPMDDSRTLLDRQYASQGEIPKRIHLLGTGNIGKLVAHSLRGIANPPPITLIFHKHSLIRAWEKNKKQITIQDNDEVVSRGGFEIESFFHQMRRQHGVELQRGRPTVYDVARTNMQPHEAAEVVRERQTLQKQRKAAKQATVPTTDDAVSEELGTTAGHYSPPTTPFKKVINDDHTITNEVIHNLIVTTKANATVAALLKIRDRLTPESTICFLQNGMGIIDDVNEKVFPDPETRPSYVEGVVTHGVNVPPGVGARNPFFAVHAGHGTIALGLIPRENSLSTPSVPQDQNAADQEPSSLTTTKESFQGEKPQDTRAPSARYILRTLTRTPVLCAVGFTPTELLQLKLEKLAVNSVINPLTALIDSRNGALLYNYALTRTVRLLLAETSLVIRSLPELQLIPNVEKRFSAKRLEILMVSVAGQTAQNISSMLSDIRSGRQTEIDWINGYIIKRGEEVGVKCVVNYGIMMAVVGKAMVTQRERQADVPIVGETELV
ncbi:hypothetical protein LTR62_002241 [Meristemomyces frigidus]|uniref:2-dehydropantoate 2-reductase n=1 Tax=Meristemomyces frigidus TaxID=1508187 RepID=A0AAN7TG63_9PEZI|nr:hypothetical protein LTR62_002241 [Meristemomyces frigidus]